MAKKHNRGRQQKRNVDQSKLDKYRTEVARELGSEPQTQQQQQEKSKKTASRGNTSSSKVDENERLR